MTDIVITAANVIAGSNSTRKPGTAGATITAGQAVYLDDADNKWKLADNNSATAAVRQAQGIALNGAALNQPLFVLTSGDITIGGTVVAGSAYYLSDTPGGLIPVADLGTGEYPCLIGMATSASVISVGIKYTGVEL